MSEEIICSECGRPNLPEAEKCWYCQAPLKPDDNAASSLNEAVGEDESFIVEGTSQETSKSDEQERDIPDWLKRVRELKKADQPEEDEVDQWRQQILFEKPDKEMAEGEIQTAEKPQSHSVSRKTSEKPKPQVNLKDQPELESKVDRPKGSPDLENEKSETETSDENDELPDGFTPMGTKQG